MTISPSPKLPFNNCVAVHPSDFPNEFVHILVELSFDCLVCEQPDLLHSLLNVISHNKAGQLVPGTIGLSLVQRQWIGILDPGGVVTVEHLPSPPHSDAPIFIHAMEIEIDFLQKGYMHTKEYLSIDMTSTFIECFRGIVMSMG